MLRPLALCALVSLLVGCPSKPKYPECKVDEDCGPHAEVCIGGFCRECRDDAQCKDKAPRTVCGKDNACGEKPQCAQTKDCAAGLKCAASKCVPECDEKTAAQDCGDGKKCIAGRCAAEEECLADADCGDGRACKEKRCVASGDLLASQSTRKLGDCEVRAVYFDYDEATLSKDAREVLDRDWDCLRRAEWQKLILAGHTDERGTTEYNLALGSRRAEEVRSYLVKLGADARKVKAISYGKERPADPGHDEAAYAKDRRVELAPQEAAK